jgi:hypothetical protein
LTLRGKFCALLFVQKCDLFCAPGWSQQRLVQNSIGERIKHHGGGKNDGSVISTGFLDGSYRIRGGTLPAGAARSQ